MGRPRKQTVDYFPHFVSTDSRTKFILEQNWGNDGYAFWFKLLELLGRSEGHYYDCSQPADKMYLVALTKVTEEQADAILEMLALRGNIDLELWREHKIIWCQSLVDNLQDVYSKRTVSAPLKPFTTPEEEQADQDPEAELEPEEKPRKRGRPRKADAAPAGERDLHIVPQGAQPFGGPEKGNQGEDGERLHGGQLSRAVPAGGGQQLPQGEERQELAGDF